MSDGPALFLLMLVLTVGMVVMFSSIEMPLAEGAPTVTIENGFRE